MGSDRIKGITIEIDGDTKKLSDALKTVNKEVTNASKSLKDVNKLLKLDPGNTDLLVQKQKYLTQAIDATKNKLKEQKAALEQLKAMPQTEETIRQQEALTREIVQTEGELKKLTAEYRNFGSVSAQQIAVAGEKIKGIGQGITQVGASLTRNVTVPLTAVGAASVKAFQEVDAGLDIVVKKTGATGEALKGLQDIVKNLAREIPTDFETAGNAVGEINTRFGLVGDELEKLSKQFIEFAQLNETDVTSSIDATQKVMEAYELTINDMGPLLDTLNKVGQDTGISMDALTSSLVSNAASLQEMGFNVADAATFLGKLEKSGVDATQVLSALKIGFKNAAKEGKTLPEALKDFDKVMNSTASETEKVNAAIELFGGRAGLTMYQAAKTGALAMDDLGRSLADNLGNVEETFKNTLDPIDQWKLTLNELKITGAEVGNVLMQTLMPMLKELAAGVKQFGETWSNMTPEMQQMIVKAGLLVAALGPVLSIVGKAVTGVGQLMTYAPKITGFFTDLSGAASSATGSISGIAAAAGPILEVAAAVAVLIAAFVHLWDTNEEFRDDMTAIWNDMVTSVNDAFSSITEAINAFGFDFENIIEMLKALWDGYTQVMGVEFKAIFEDIAAIVKMVAGTFEGLGKIITGVLTGDASKAVEGFGKIFTSVFGGLVEVAITPLEIIFGMWGKLLGLLGVDLPGAAESAGEAIADAFSGIGDFFVGLGQEIGSAFSDTWTNITTGVRGAVETIVVILTSVGEQIIAFFAPITETVVNIVSAAFTELQPLIEAFQYLFETVVMAIQILWEQAWTEMQAKFLEVWTAIVEFFMPIIETIRSAIETAWNAILMVTTTVFTAVQAFFMQVWTAISAFLTPILTTIQTAVQTAWMKVQEVTQSIFTRIQEFITNIWTKIKEAASSKLNEIVSTIKNKLNEAMNFIKNLSSQAYKWGADLINGLARGIRSGIGAVSGAVREIADKIRSNLHFSRPDEGPLREYEKWMPDMMKGMAEGIRNNIGLVQNALAETGKAMSGAITQDYTPQLDRIGSSLTNINTGMVAAAGTTGDIYIPVYLGSELIDEIVVSAAQRNSYRSGGR